MRDQGQRRHQRALLSRVIESQVRADYAHFLCKASHGFLPYETLWQGDSCIRLFASHWILERIGYYVNYLRALTSITFLPSKTNQTGVENFFMVFRPVTVILTSLDCFSLSKKASRESDELITDDESKR